MPDVKLSMQFGAANFSAEGTQEFVNSMLNKWVQLSTDSTFAVMPSPSQGASKVAGNAKPDSATALQFENVYDEIDGELKIIAQMAGDNKATKTRNTALVLLYGNYLRGQQTTTADDIRAACVDQGCLDAGNFSSHLKGLKEKVAMNTKAGGGYDVKLTAPGRKAAQELVEKINNEAV